MVLTPKQARNGIPDTGPTGGNVSQPGPSSDVAAVKSAAETYGGALQESGKGVFDGGGMGSTTVVDWDDIIAVTEQPGEI